MTGPTSIPSTTSPPADHSSFIVSIHASRVVAGKGLRRGPWHPGQEVLAARRDRRGERVDVGGLPPAEHEARRGEMVWQPLHDLMVAPAAGAVGAISAQPRMPTARDTTRSSRSTDTEAWPSIVSLAQGARGIVSVGLKAIAFVNDR